MRGLDGTATLTCDTPSKSFGDAILVQCGEPCPPHCLSLQHAPSCLASLGRWPRSGGLGGLGWVQACRLQLNLTRWVGRKAGDQRGARLHEGLI